MPLSRMTLIKKPPTRSAEGLVQIRSLAVTYFHMGTPTLSSAQSSFTSEFEMGSGGSHSLWPPGKNVLVAHGSSHANKPNLVQSGKLFLGISVDSGFFILIK